MNGSSNAVTELSFAEVEQVSGGVAQYTTIASWAVGTSGAFQKMMVAKLEVLGNPIGH
ncbi:MAG: hypothetical protein ABI612_07435 [Betaproteobacteria bacterium]